MKIIKNKRKYCVVTTSWDDGHPLDLKLAGLLKKYDLKGTFYIPLNNTEQTVIGERDIKKISKYFEVGAHGVSHEHLTTIPLREVIYEATKSKEFLESIIRKNVLMFCYPAGRYNKNIINILKDAGYVGARTVKQFQVRFPKDPFQIETTIHVHPFSYRKYTGNVLRNVNFSALKHIKVFLTKPSLVDISMYYFDYIYKHGGVFHLWGHSWEIDKFGLWDELEKIFCYISSRSKVIYVPNCFIALNQNY